MDDTEGSYFQKRVVLYNIVILYTYLKEMYYYYYHYFY